MQYILEIKIASLYKIYWFTLSEHGAYKHIITWYVNEAWMTWISSYIWKHTHFVHRLSRRNKICRCQMKMRIIGYTNLWMFRQCSWYKAPLMFRQTKNPPYRAQRRQTLHNDLCQSLIHREKEPSHSKINKIMLFS